MKKNVLCSLLIGLLPFVGCSGPTLLSSWQNDEIIIDGSRQDWGKDIKYFEDEQMALSVKNDNDYLYLYLATSERTKIIKILQNGLTVWLDPQNSDGETIGIQFPIKKLKGPNEQIELRNIQKHSNNDQSFKQILRKIKSHQNEILIINEDRFPLNAIPTKNKGGIEAEFGIEMKQLVYELKVPLANTKMSNIYVDALPEESLKISFESGKNERPEVMRRRSEMGMTGGSRGGMRGSRKNRGQNMKGNMEPINFSIYVQLSSQN